MIQASVLVGKLDTFTLTMVVSFFFFDCRNIFECVVKFDPSDLGPDGQGARVCPGWYTHATAGIILGDQNDQCNLAICTNSGL